MTGKERIKAAFSKAGTPEIPAGICYDGAFFDDHWGELLNVPLWYNAEYNIKYQVEWFEKVIRSVNLDLISIPFYSLIENELIIPDIGGMKFTGTWNNHSDNNVNNFEDIDRYAKMPEFHNNRQHGCEKLHLELMESFCNRYPIYYISSPLWCCHYLWNFEELMIKIHTCPELVRYACKIYLEKAIKKVHEAVLSGAKAIWIQECYTDMIHPETFKSINIPYVSQLIEEIRCAGLKSIYYFTGNPHNKLDMIISSNPDAIALEEGKKNFTIDIEDIVDTVKGRCTILGNLNAINILQNASEEELKTEVLRQLSAGRKNKNRFIMSLGSPVTPYTSPGRVRLYCEMVHKYGR